MTVLFVNDTRVTDLPAGWTALASHGTEAWTWHVLDQDLQQIDVLSGVVDGSGRLDFNVAADTRGSGDLTWVGAPQDQPDWVNILLQPWFSLTTPDGQVLSWPMGVFIPSTPTVLYDDSGWLAVTVTMFDRTLRPRQRSFAFDPYTPNLIDPLHVFVREILGYADLQHSIEETTKTARTSMVFLPGTTYLAAINSILDAAGFFALYADGEGILRSQAYDAPANRPVAYTFTDGDGSVFTPGVPVQMDWFSIPNRILAYSQETGDEPRLEAEAYNLDADDPLSITNRGYVDEVLEGVEAADQSTLQAHADRALAERRGRGATFELEHAPLPLMVNDRVDLDYAGAGLQLPGVIQTLSIDCRPGALWKSSVRQVAAAFGGGGWGGGSI